MKKYLFMFVAVALGLSIVSSAQARSLECYGPGRGVVLVSDHIRVPLPPFPFFLPPPPFISVRPSYDCDYEYGCHRPYHRHYYRHYHDYYRGGHDRHHRPHGSYRHRDWRDRDRYY